MFYNVGGYENTETGAGDYIATASITGTYVPLALELFNEIVEPESDLSIDFGLTSTSGNIFSDRILTEMAAYFADQEFDKMAIDPETGQRTNRHYTNFVELLKMRYGIRFHNGIFYSPREASAKRASIGYAVIENKE